MDQVAATTEPIVDLDVGDQWEIGITVPAGSTVAAAVTAPDGDVANPEPSQVSGGVTVVVPLEQAGRYLAVLTVSGPVAAVVPFVANAGAPTPALPDRAAVRAYLDSVGESSATDEAIDEALAAETANQRRLCDVPAVYEADLAEALKRRVARNLAARAVPIAQMTSFETGAVTQRVTRYDAEVTRLEGPYRKVVVG
jgi:hypothetical protein